jgi:hypothetical protein
MQIDSQPGECITTTTADFRFVEVCEPGTLVVDSITCEKPIAIGARIDRNGVIRIEMDRHLAESVRISIRVTGIRRGFLGKRFSSRTREQFLANERFINSAYPGDKS